MSAPQKTRTDFVMTQTAAEIIDVVHECHEKGWMGVVVGAPGVGKSEALRHYARSHTHSAFYVELTNVEGSAAGVMYAMTSAAGGYLAERTSNDMKIDALARALDRRYNKCILLIDEAQELRPDGLRALKDVHNKTNVSILLSGNEQVLSRFYNRKGEILPGYAQVDSRIRIRRTFLKPTATDITILAAHHGIKGGSEIEFLFEIADLGRGLRWIDTVIGKASELCAGNPIDETSLRDAALYLGMIVAKPSSHTQAAPLRRQISTA